MAINETLVKNRFYRHCTDAAAKAWQRISFWTHCEDVELPNGKTLGTNNSLSAGIIDTLSGCVANTVSKNIAGANALKELNRNLAGLSFGQDADGKWGYKPTGADSVIPFSSENIDKIVLSFYVQQRSWTDKANASGKSRVVITYTKSGSNWSGVINSTKSNLWNLGEWYQIHGNWYSGEGHLVGIMDISLSLYSGETLLANCTF